MAAAPTDALATMMRDARKRRRVEGEGEEKEPQPEYMARFPTEVQFAIVEAVESAHREATPTRSTKMLEAARVLIDIYRLWLGRRRAQIERPPNLFTLALARLFVSPRWKLITSLKWSVARRILEAYIDFAAPDAARVLLLMQVGRAGWVTATLDPIGPATAPHPAKREFEEATFAIEFADRLAFGGVATEFGSAPDGGTLISLREDGVLLTHGDAVADRAIVYGSVAMILDWRSYAHFGTVGWIVASMRTAFFGLSDSDFTESMLGWRGKVAILLVTAYPHTGDEPLNARVILVEGDDEIERDVALSGWKRDTIGETVGVAVREATGAGTRPAYYVRTEIDWFNGATMVLHDAVEGFAIDEDLDGDAIQAAFESAREPKLASLYPDAGSRWGYEMSMYMPPFRDRTPVGGLLIMPLPWFFFATRAAVRFLPEETSGATFARMRFGWSVNKIRIAALGSDSPLNYATHELVWLPDAISDADLEDLTMLQKRDLPERATARAPDVVAL